MSTVKGVSYIGGSPTTRPKPGRQDLVNAVSQHSLTRIMAALSSMFDGVDDSLFELANHAHTNNEQNRYFEAMREMRIKRKGVEGQFVSALQDLFESPKYLHTSQTAESHALDTNPESLSLVNNDTLEERVAISSMATKAKATFTGSLLQLQTRLSTLYENCGEHNPVNPLEPSRVCEAFGDACSDLAIEIREKLIVFKQFDRYVIGNLGETLDEANQILIKAGVLPTIKHQAQKGRVRPRSSTEELQLPPTEELETSAVSGEWFHQIRQLLQNVRLQAQNRQTPHQMERLKSRGLEGPVHTISSQDLFHLISQLPLWDRGNAEGTLDNLAEGPAIPVNLRSTLQALLDQEGERTGQSSAVEPIDEDLINLVSMLFEFILDDYNLSAPVQVLISRLQIPILKVAIKDKTFFSKPSHPARQLLNALAKAGIGWSEASERKRDKLYDQIHHTVKRILTEFNGNNIELFAELYEAFTKANDKEEHKTKLVEKRTQETEAGRIKSQKAHRIVDEIVRQKLADRELPEVVRELFRHGWNRVMFLAYLREESEHRFRHSVRVVDELVWCLYPHTDEEMRRRWVKIVPQLLKQIKAGLLESGLENAKLETLLNELKKVLTDSFKQYNPSATGREMPRIDIADTEETIRKAIKPPPKPKTAVEIQDEIESSVLAEFSNRIQALELGSWVEFSLVNGSRFRCKLLSRVEDGERLIFVNRLGLKVVDKHAQELAHELRKGRMHILDEGLLVDRAMNAVVGNLRKMSGRAA